MPNRPTPPSPQPRASLLAPWLALGAGLGALAAVPNRDPVAVADAFTPPITVSTADPTVANFTTALATAPSMRLPAPPAGPAIRFTVGGPSIAGFVSVATVEDIHPEALSRPAQIDRIFAVAGNLIKPLPDGFSHPLLSDAAPTQSAPARSSSTTDTRIPEELRRLAGDTPEPYEPAPEQWAQLRWCESSGNYQASNFSGKYRGAYQFDQATWESVGGSGDPAEADPAEQDKRAKVLFATRGSAPWPYCGRYLD